MNGGDNSYTRSSLGVNVEALSKICLQLIVPQSTSDFLDKVAKFKPCLEHW